MLIVVASGNIFRRELSSYILGEAGYEICEARTVEGLLSHLRARRPDLLLIDLQLEAGDPVAIVRAVRHVSAAPIIWITDQLGPRQPPRAEQGQAGLISWPFRGDELAAAVAASLAPTRPSIIDPQLRERYAGSTE